MTYKPEDLRYHYHEHGPECPSDDAHAQAFRSEAFQAAALSLSDEPWADLYVIGGPVEVRALIGDLQSLGAKMSSLCQWPQCGNDGLCRSGNFGDLIVCADHFKITNGSGVVIIEAGEEIREDDPVAIRDGKAYRA